MLPQQFQQLEEPNQSSVWKDVGLPIILVIATVLGSIIGAIVLGTTHVIGFNWVLVIWGCIMLVIAVFFAWYSLRTRFIFQNKYQADLKALREAFYGLQSNFTGAANHEFNRLNETFIAYSQKNTEEQTERLEEMRKQLLEKISDAKNGMEGSVNNATTTFSSAVKSYERAVELYKEQYLQIAKRMTILEEQLKKESLPES